MNLICPLFNRLLVSSSIKNNSVFYCELYKHAILNYTEKQNAQQKHLFSPKPGALTAQT